MWHLLYKLFVRSFYQANAGFFLFFFFIFFGAVQDGSLISYHLSLMHSILTSYVILSLVMFCWLLYHVKCTAFFLKMINSSDGKFLYNLQALAKKRQWLTISGLYITLYTPVLLYSLLLGTVGLQKGYIAPVIILSVFHAISLVIAVTIILNRLNNWLYTPRSFAILLSFPKTYLLYVFYYFLLEKRTLFLVLKMLSLALLYTILVWNKGKYDNSSFLLFYLVLLLAHAILPYLAVQFIETKMAVYRNLPVSLVKRALVFLVAYALILVPEGLYISLLADKFPIEIRIAYYVNAVVTLFLLTSIQYSEAFNRDEYIKACFVLFFISIFALHIQAFFVWLLIQSAIAIILFTSGYYSLSSPCPPEGKN